MIEYKEDGIITIDKTKKKKVKCFNYHYKPLNRKLIIHSDIDNKGITNLSDAITGYKLFSIPIQSDKIKLNDIEEKLEKYVAHFTVEGIAEEFTRIEKLTTGKIK